MMGAAMRRQWEVIALYASHPCALSRPLEPEVALLGVFIETEHRFLERNATDVDVQLLIETPIDDVSRNAQRDVDLNCPFAALRVGVAQPAPLRLRFEGAKHTRGLPDLVRTPNVFSRR